MCICKTVKQAKLLVLPVSWLPSWISSARRDVPRNRKYTIRKLDPEKHWCTGVAVGILSLCALELEICVPEGIPHPVAGKRREKPLPRKGLKVKTPSIAYCRD